MKTATHTSATTIARPARRSTVDFAGTLGLLSATLTRAAELPGRLGDARELRARLRANRDDLQVDLARAQQEEATSRRFGREFDARRAGATVAALLEEVADVDAMLGEVGRVERRLHREARAIEHRLTLCASLAAELPSSDERARALDLIERARQALLWGEGAADQREVADYTFMRVEAKQIGQAR